MTVSDPFSMSVKELKVAIIAAIGEAELTSKQFVEKSEFQKLLVEIREIAKNKKLGIFMVASGKYILGGRL
jgi:hypothetical protein